MRAPILSVLAVVILATNLSAQSPVPVVVPAVTPATAVKASGPAEPDPVLAAALKMLQEMKAANEETLRKQTATLQQLDLIEKDAEQIRIYTKRS